MSANMLVGSLYDLHFPPLPSTSHVKSSVEKSSLPDVIHSSFWNCNALRNVSLIECGKAEKHNSPALREALSPSSSTDFYDSEAPGHSDDNSDTASISSDSASENEEEHEDLEREANSRNYLDERSQALADEYFRKIDFGKERRPKHR